MFLFFYSSVDDDNGSRLKRSIDGTGTSANNKTSIPDFSLRAALTNCRAWDEAKQKWDLETCKASFDLLYT